MFPESDVRTVLSNLSARGFDARWAATKEEAAADMLAGIAPGESVGIGGSMSVKETGICDLLLARGNPVYWHWLPGEGDARRKAMTADVYLCSANALTAGGELVSIDGFGNRTGAMVYGPERCFIVCGVNKLTADVASALERIKTVACPQNARRLGLDVPCARTGRCFDCAAGKRMCRVTTIYSYPRVGRETRVYLVGEPLGF
ncbi:MAG: lactate utilization protein [Oscillospiraceae bacterium]|nr:lactate utilization protein [Oscillospiraceae bacterium]